MIYSMNVSVLDELKDTDVFSLELLQIVNSISIKFRNCTKSLEHLNKMCLDILGVKGNVLFFDYLLRDIQDGDYSDEMIFNNMKHIKSKMSEYFINDDEFFDAMIKLKLLISTGKFNPDELQKIVNYVIKDGNLYGSSQDKLKLYNHYLDYCECLKQENSEDDLNSLAMRISSVVTEIINEIGNIETVLFIIGVINNVINIEMGASVVNKIEAFSKELCNVERSVN